MAKSKSKNLPSSNSLEELIKFFDSHDMGEYWDQMPEAYFDVNIKKGESLLTTESETYEEKVKSGFQKVLNENGYGFQYSVLNLAGNLYKQSKSVWSFEAAEFPVQVQGVGTKIDFILKRRDFPFYLLAECKRANPALSNWCFARAPYVKRNRSDYEPLFLEQVQRGEQNSLHAFAKMGLKLHNAYHIALEVKSNIKGDTIGKGRGAIEETATQICRGLNGMIEFLYNNIQMLGNANSGYFMPVIFTTAQVWSSEVDLSSANINDGNVDLSKTDFSKKPWVAYQYHLSPGLKHSYSPDNRPNSLGDVMELEYVRTIPIVSVSGIEKFMEWSSNLSLRQIDNITY